MKAKYVLYSVNEQEVVLKSDERDKIIAYLWGREVKGYILFVGNGVYVCNNPDVLEFMDGVP